MNRNKKGFTLIELIVVISIIAIIVGLATGITKGYTKEANLSRHMSYVKELESASERYYMNNNDWPRANEEPMTSEELATYATRIKDITGKDVELETGGKYYTINYQEISKYTKIPKNKENYILQNPVGQVYYLENLTELGKSKLNIVSPTDNIAEIKNVKEYVNTIITMNGLGEEAFDGNESTRVSLYKSAQVNLQGDLTDRVIKIVGSGDSGSSLYVQFINTDGQALKPIGESSTPIMISQYSSGVKTKYYVIPEGTSQLKFTTGGTGYVYEIQVLDPLGPKDIPKSTITSTETTSSITLNWNVPYTHSIINEEGKIAVNVSGNSYTHKPLYSEELHTYVIYIVNNEGKFAKVTYEVTTKSNENGFTGITGEAVDGDITTRASLSRSANVTWKGNLEGKEITIVGSGNSGSSLYVQFRDINGKALNPVGKTSALNLIAQYGVGVKTIKLIVPEGATELYFSSGGTGYVYELTVQ